MLSFFRVNDPYRIIILFIAVTFIRLPFFIASDSFTIPELNWMIVGENMSNGKVLYAQIYEVIAPLAAFVYFLIDFVFGRSQLAYQLIALLLVGAHFYLFNNIMYKSKAYNENSYIPALVYAILMQIFFDFASLSPVLMSLTFVLLVINNIYIRIENKLDDGLILKTGIFMGIAVLLYLPSIVFFLATIVCFILFTGLIFRRYLLFVYGFFVPFGIVLIYFFLNGAVIDLYYNWIYPTFVLDAQYFISPLSLTIIFSIPLLLLIQSLVRTFATSRFTNYQVRVQQVMLIMLIACVGCWFISYRKAPYQFIVFIPFASFFIAHLFLQIRRKALAEIGFTFITFMILFFNYGVFYRSSILNDYINYQPLMVQKTILDQQVKGKSIMVLGKSTSLYKKASLSGPYLNWDLSKSVWKNPENPFKVAEIYQQFEEELPDVLIDLEASVAPVFQYLPTIADKYQKTSAYVYEKISKEENTD